MAHPCPGVVVHSSLPEWTTEIAPMSPKHSAQTNSPYGNRLRRTPHLGYNTIPTGPRTYLSSYDYGFPQSTSGFRSAWSLPSRPDSAHFGIPSPLPQESFARTLIIPNQGLGSFPGKVPSIIPNMTQNDTQLAPFHDPLTVRLGRGLQLLRCMTGAIEFPQTAVLTTQGSLGQLTTCTTALDRFASHDTRKQARETTTTTNTRKVATNI